MLSPPASEKLNHERVVSEHSVWRGVLTQLWADLLDLFATSEQTDASGGRGGRCETHPHAAWCRGASLRFNVGWQWADISLTVTEHRNRFLLEVRECEAWPISAWRSVTKLTLHTCIYPNKYGPISSGVREFLDMSNAIWTVHKSSFWEYEECVFWFVLVHTAHALLTWCVCLERVREARGADLWDETAVAAALLLFILSSAWLPTQLRQSFKLICPLTGLSFCMLHCLDCAPDI